MYLKTRRENGQALILMVMIMCMAGVTFGLTALKGAHTIHRDTIGFRRSAIMMTVLDAASRKLQAIYKNEANCDPYLFNIRMNQPIPAIDRQGAAVSFSRAVQLHPYDIEGDITNNYLVRVGEINPKPATPGTVPFGAGVVGGPNPVAFYAPASGAYGPQDISVTFWLAPFMEAASGESYPRYQQTIALINTCTDGAPPVGSVANTPAGAGDSPAWGIVNTQANGYASYAGTAPLAAMGVGLPYAVSNACGAGFRGSSVAGSSLIRPLDRNRLRTFLASGLTGGEGDTANPPLPDTQVPTTLVEFRTCMDLDRNSRVNWPALTDADLSILEKVLKGYFYYHIPMTAL